MADYYLGLALDAEWHGGDSGVDRAYGRGHSRPYKRREDNTSEVLARDYWVDANGRRLYPERIGKPDGMALEYIRAVKRHMLGTRGHDVKSSTLWRALCAGERLHEDALRKCEELNKGLIQW